MNFKEEQKEKVEKIEAILREYLPENFDMLLVASQDK